MPLVRAQLELVEPTLLSSPPLGVGALARARGELWRFLPTWMFFFYAVLLLNAGLTNFSPPRRDLAWLTVFPLAVFIGFYAVRAAFAPEVSNRRALFSKVLGLSAGVLLLVWLGQRPSPMSERALRAAYEISALLWAALMVVHAWRTHRSHVAVFFAVGLAYGVVLENSGIVMGYFHEQQLTLTAMPPFVAPASTMVGWSVVLYIATATVWSLRRWLPALKASALLSGVLMAAVATLLDLQIDPHATAMGAWVWHPSLPPFFHGVPLTNFIAWMVALYPFGWVMFRYQQQAGLADGAPWSRRDVWALFKRLPAAATLALASFVVCAALLEGLDGPSMLILKQFVGQLTRG